MNFQGYAKNPYFKDPYAKDPMDEVMHERNVQAARQIGDKGRKLARMKVKDPYRYEQEKASYFAIMNKLNNDRVKEVENHYGTIRGKMCCTWLISEIVSGDRYEDYIKIRADTIIKEYKLGLPEKNEQEKLKQTEETERRGLEFQLQETLRQNTMREQEIQRQLEQANLIAQEQSMLAYAANQEARHQASLREEAERQLLDMKEQSQLNQDLQNELQKGRYILDSTSATTLTLAYQSDTLPSSAAFIRLKNVLRSMSVANCIEDIKRENGLYIIEAKNSANKARLEKFLENIF